MKLDLNLLAQIAKFGDKVLSRAEREVSTGGEELAGLVQLAGKTFDLYVETADKMAGTDPVSEVQLRDARESARAIRYIAEITAPHISNERQRG